MIDVLVIGDSGIVGKLIGVGNELQAQYRFTREPKPQAVRLVLSSFLTRGLFCVDRARGVTLSTHESEGIAYYLGVQRETYLLMCSLVGLTKWRALALNPLLNPEDFIHREPARCMFARQPTIQHYALAFEKPHICTGCRDFFQYLGVELEILALENLFESCPVAC